MSRDSRTKHSAVAISAVAVVTIGLAILLHESAHVLAGWLAGGSPTLMTSTEVRGDFSTLSAAGLFALGASGSLVNILFCGLGWWTFRRSTSSPELRLFGWYLFAVNGSLVTCKMAGEAIFGFGDWMTILRSLPGMPYSKGVVAVVGIFGVITMVRLSGAALRGLLSPTAPTSRRSQGLRLVLVGAFASAVFVMGCAATGPVGTTRGILLALGAGVGPFLPMLFAVRVALKGESTTPVAYAMGTWPFIAAAVATTVVGWAIVGPGVDLTGLMP